MDRHITHKIKLKQYFFRISPEKRLIIATHSSVGLFAKFESNRISINTLLRNNEPITMKFTSFLTFQ